MPSKNKKKVSKSSSEILHYFFYFKNGDYFKVSHALEDEYPDIFEGSGFCLDGHFDCSFSCTKSQKDDIRKFISSQWPKLKFTVKAS